MRSRKPAPRQPAQVEAWRRALADHAKTKRNQRGRRPAKQITGIRIPPPPRDDRQHDDDAGQVH